MAGKIIDLNQSGSTLPSDFVVDTNLLVVQFLGHVNKPRTADQQKARLIFPAISAGTCTGYVTPTSLVEFYHLYVRFWYEQELKAQRKKYQGLLQRRFGKRQYRWHHLYKIRPGLMQRVAQDLQQLHLILVASGLFLLQPWDLSWSPSGVGFEDELAKYMRRYQLDASDAQILVEADKVGIDAIATLDQDYVRARKVFKVVTWL